MKNEQEKSDLFIVAMKPADKPGQPEAEPVEPRERTEGNTEEQQREERVVQQFRYIFSGQMCPESVMIEKWLVKKSSIEIKQWNPR
jgi:hypothetical protein